MKYKLIFLAMLLASPLWAVEPDEILQDPALEARARNLSQGLRCLVCQNESIDESHAPLARDLRILVRERLVAGESDAEVIDFIVNRYGEYVLLKPKNHGVNLLLWGAGPLMLLLGLGMAGGYLRGRSQSKPESADILDEKEQLRLNEILNRLDK